ncbi:transglutaminase domain-containing protein [Butyrivibrio sp. WCE2006]|uniref:transglutaminase domain-containing protein n=1 Tax=Butyrivibrio sp. WCE2006 TaxID=1410611 RepID=UPI0005D2B2EE|nr:transglutaminase domain-containing protein [Butyrivibrio sp. WCE2006]
MKKRILTGLMAVVTAFTVAAPIWGIKAEAKYVTSIPLYPCSAAQEADLTNRTLAVANSIASSATGEANEKVKYFHDKICEITTYSNTGNYDEAYPTGVFLYGKAKCIGYSSAFKLLCDISDIPCMEVFGNIRSEGHAWNIVQLQDGQWYEVDVTNDDDRNGQVCTYDYFLVTTEQISKLGNTRGNSRLDTQLNTGVPIAYGTKYAYEDPNVKEEDYQKDNHLVISDKETKAQFAINTKEDTCQLIRFPKKVTKYIVPDTITYKEHVLTVNGISIDSPSKIKELIIGNNIKRIYAESFTKCKYLKKITIKSEILNSIGKNAFKGISNKAVIMMPKNKFKEYKKILTKKSGIPKTAKYKKF